MSSECFCITIYGKLPEWCMVSFWRQGRLWHFWKREKACDQHSNANHLDWDWPRRIVWKLGDKMFISKKQKITLITWPAEQGKIQECDDLGWTTPPPRIRKENWVSTRACANAQKKKKHIKHKGLSTYYVSQFHWFSDPPSPPRQQSSAIAWPPLPPSSVFVSIWPTPPLSMHSRKTHF